MKILLTGACGLVGRAIMRCAGDMHDFVPLDISADVNGLPGGIHARITDRHAVLRAAKDCDAIIHTAAMHGTSKGEASNQEFIATNVIGAENLFEASVTHGIRRLVISSTLEVLCGGNWDAWGRTVYDEKLAPRPDWI